MQFRRVIWIVMDGVGCGELPDAGAYGDRGSNSLSNVASKVTLSLPHLEKLGLGNITSIAGVRALAPNDCIGAFGKAAETSPGKDTTTGHWEMTGLQVRHAFPTFPNGFPNELVQEWIKENQLPGVLGNRPASGTEIIDELGAEHIRTGKPILYTSADSVWQVASHEESFGLERLYKICKSARKICDRVGIGRVIARPFIGDPAKGVPFKRTYNRKDLSVTPPTPSYLDLLRGQGVHVRGLGKISNIFDGKGIDDNIDTEGNEDGMTRLIGEMDRGTHSGISKPELLFCNLIDFDMLYGHRRDVRGYASALVDFDARLGELLAKIKTDDLLLITSDHGNDPTFAGTDHTREYVPVLAYSGRPDLFRGHADLGVRRTFADLGATAFSALTGQESAPQSAQLLGKSFLPAARPTAERAR